MSGIYTRKNVGINGLVENRTEDHINEEWFRDIIDVNLYDRIDGFEYKRMLDKANQLKGIDVDAHLGNEHFIIDEKVQTRKLKVKNKKGKFTYFRDGKEHIVKVLYNKLSTNKVRYDVVNCYEKLLDIVNKD